MTNLVPSVKSVETGLNNLVAYRMNVMVKTVIDSVAI